MAVARGLRNGTRFAPYLPRIALEWVARPNLRWQTLEASLLFADVSGFTALSERLARIGAAGAEELTDLVGGCFTDLLADAYADGGSLLKFGGDALLIAFDGPDHASRAVSAANAMRRTTRRVGHLKTSAGNVRLRTSCGIHSGLLHLFCVGQSHRELIVTGPLASRTLDMETAAGAGQIVVSPETAAAILPELVGDERSPGLLLRDRLLPGRGVHGFKPAPAIDATKAIPLAVRAHLQRGRTDSEHRYVAVAFIRFSGVDRLLETEGPDHVAEVLEEVVTSVQAAADDHEVTFLGTDIDRDGGKIVLVAGAPQAKDDDSGRMLAAVRRIIDAGSSVPIRIGAHRGYVFAGDIGPAYRRTYTVMGDAVNLSARLMAAADDREILATEELLNNARRAYSAAPRPPFMVKGKSKPVRAFALGAAEGVVHDATAHPGRVLPLVGRTAEKALIRGLRADSAGGAGAAIDISGPAGIGKTRLVDEVCRELDGRRLVCVASEPYESSTPWSTMRRFLLQALDIDSDARSLADEIERRVAALSPDSARWLPLIGDVLGESLPPTPQTAALEPSFARQRTNEVISTLLREAFDGSAVLVFEDVQWIDESSAGALEVLRGAVEERPWLLVTTRRSEGPVTGAEGDSSHRIFLGPLDDAAAGQLVDAATADAPLHPHRRADLVRHAGGNPLFLEELIRAGAHAGEDEELPDSVQALVASALDRVPARYRRLLQYAAVLGAEFGRETLERVASEALPSRATLLREWGDLAVASADGALRFRNRIVRDVAYQTLSFRKRRELHGRAAETIERETAGEANPPAELLSLHYLHAQRFYKCWRWAVKGGSRAKTLYANVEAARLLERALVAARYLPDLDQRSIGKVWEAQADAWHAAGEYERAEAAYRQARRYTSDPLRLARLHMYEARIAELRGNTSTAVRRLRRAMRLTEVDHPKAAAVRADLEVLHGWISQRQGKLREAKKWAEQALDSASVNSSARAEAYLLMEWLSLHLGSSGPQDRAHKALITFERKRNLSRVGFTQNVLGAFAYYRGSWDEAGEFYRKALDSYERAGNEADAAKARYNAAEIRLDQGRLDEAEAMLEEIVRVYRAVGYPPGLALTSRDLGRIAARRGQFVKARRLLDDAREILLGFGATAAVLEVDMWSAELMLREGAAAEALQLIRDVASRAAEEMSATLAPGVYRLVGYVHASLGQVAEARAALDQSLADARARGALYEVARTLEALKWIADREGDEWSDALEGERVELFDRLGLLAAPVSPGAASDSDLVEAAP